LRSVSLSVQSRGFEASASFSLSGLTPTQPRHSLKVPPGKVVVTRSLDFGQGTSIVIPDGTVEIEIKPGASEQINIGPLTEQQRQQAQQLYRQLFGKDK